MALIQLKTLNMSCQDIAEMYAKEIVFYRGRGSNPTKCPVAIVGWYDAALKTKLGAPLAGSDCLIVSTHPTNRPPFTLRRFATDYQIVRYPTCYKITVDRQPEHVAMIGQVYFWIDAETVQRCVTKKTIQMAESWWPTVPTQPQAPKEIPLWPHKCDSCNGEAYVSALSIECNTPGCRRFSCAK